MEKDCPPEYETKYKKNKCMCVGGGNHISYIFQGTLPWKLSQHVLNKYILGQIWIKMKRKWKGKSNKKVH